MSEVTLFNYDDLTHSEAQEVHGAAERIRLRMKRTAEDIIEIGRELSEVKHRLPHGTFLQWVKAEFDMSRDTAVRFMQVSETYGDKCGTMRHLTPTVLYKLSSPSMPDEVREEVEERVKAGEKVTNKEVEDLKKRHREQLDGLGNDLVELEGKVEGLQNLLTGAEEERERLKNSLAETVAQAKETARQQALMEVENGQAEELKKLEEKIKSLNNSIAQKSHKLSGLNAKTQETQARLDMLDEEIKKIRNHDAEEADLSNQIDKIEFKLHGFSLLLTDLEYIRSDTTLKKLQRLGRNIHKLYEAIWAIEAQPVTITVMDTTVNGEMLQ